MEENMISVIMGIYNCEETLGESINCILNQTYQNVELIMCDDGSTDGTLTIAEKYHGEYPDRIVLLKNDKNRGLNYTLNHCLKYAKGTYIARMDGDDLCAESRLEKELEILQNEPEIAIVSTGMEYFDEDGVWGKYNPKAYPDKKDFLNGTPFCHAPCLVRKEAYDAVNGYSESKRLLRVEDYHLWFKMYCAGYRGKNIEEPLYQMRDDRNAYHRRKFKYRINEAYVKQMIIKEFHLPMWNYIYVLRPILVGLLPNKLYDFLHKKNKKAVKRHD